MYVLFIKKCQKPKQTHNILVRKYFKHIKHYKTKFDFDEMLYKTIGIDFEVRSS